MTTNKTRQQFRDEWPIIKRENGLIEIACPHGIGHPSLKLTKKLSDEKFYYGTHGCDGCCWSAGFALAEMSHDMSRIGELK